MPHTKRKGTVRGKASMPRTSSPQQLSIEQFISRTSSQDAVSVPAVPHSGGAMEDLGFDVTLSPPALRPPPHPEGRQNQRGSLESEEGVDGEPLIEGAGAAIPDGSQRPEGLSLEGKLLKSAPGSVSLENIWSVLQQLAVNVDKSTKELSTLVSTMNVFSESLTGIKKEFTAQTLKLNQDVKKLQDLSSEMIKDKNIIARKIDQIENYNRRLNLRILNFPREKGVTPLDAFKKYLIEILKYTPETLPPVNKIYYIMNKISLEAGSLTDKPLNLMEQTNLNLSELLEATVSDQSERMTLMVQFVFLQDVEAIKRLYFRRINDLFYGKTVRIFQDVTKQTQDIRKSFLSMRKETQELGASFFLNYPSKCVVKHQGLKYIFFQPEQLRVFIDSRKL